MRSQPDASSSEGTALPSFNLPQGFWHTLGRLRGTRDADEFRQLVAALLLLRFGEPAFDRYLRRIRQQPHADPDDPDEFRALGLVYVTDTLRWSRLIQVPQGEFRAALQDTFVELAGLHPTLEDLLPLEALNHYTAKELIEIARVVDKAPIPEDVDVQDVVRQITEYLERKKRDREAARQEKEAAALEPMASASPLPEAPSLTATEHLLDLGYESVEAVLPSPERDRSVLRWLLRDHLAEAVTPFLPPSLPGPLGIQLVEHALLRCAGNLSDLVRANWRFHRLLLYGVPTPTRQAQGRTLPLLRQGGGNRWAVVETKDAQELAPFLDGLVYLNGIPVIGLAQAALEGIEEAQRRVEQALKAHPDLFVTNLFCVVADGERVFVGIPQEKRARFHWQEWRAHAEGFLAEVEGSFDLALSDLLEPSRLETRIRDSIYFELGRGSTQKRLVPPETTRALEQAVERTIGALTPSGERTAGIFWLPYNSQRYRSIALFAYRLLQHPKVNNMLVVVVTDRYDIGNNLIWAFERCRSLFKEPPRIVDNRNDLRQFLNLASGEVLVVPFSVFLPQVSGDTFPRLSERARIVCIADGAYPDRFRQVPRGALRFREILPNAVFAGFTSEPPDRIDESVTMVFGEPVYEERFTALPPLVHEPRLREAEGVWTDLSEPPLTVVQKMSNPARLRQVAEDILYHLDWLREADPNAKAIAWTITAEASVRLYEIIRELRPELCEEDVAHGAVKILAVRGSPVRGEGDFFLLEPEQYRILIERFNNPDDPLSLLIVFDPFSVPEELPLLRAIYCDRPMTTAYAGRFVGPLIENGGSETSYPRLVDYVSGYHLAREALEMDPQFRTTLLMLSIDELVNEFRRAFERARRHLESLQVEEAEPSPQAVLHVAEALLRGTGIEEFGRVLRRLMITYWRAITHPHLEALRPQVQMIWQAGVVLGAVLGTKAPPEIHDLVLSAPERLEWIQRIFGGERLLREEVLERLHRLGAPRLAAWALWALLTDFVEQPEHRGSAVVRRVLSQANRALLEAKQEENDERIFQALAEAALRLAKLRKLALQAELDLDAAAFYDYLKEADIPFTRAQLLARRLGQIPREALERRSPVTDPAAIARVMAKRALREARCPQEVVVPIVLELTAQVEALTAPFPELSPL
ncbi:MAG: hypothetical protein KatS3mg115_0298 [Candidatus Poribacteria bacterium]|nr:MAG: hypothetical protein KatS3mg115_0298 [Candidatus Poribacteria bacterium]